MPEEQTSHLELTTRLERLSTALRSRLSRDLKPGVVDQILRPLVELMEDTRELAELDRVHTELENKIIKPVTRAGARGLMVAVLFGVVGVIGVFGSLYNIRQQGGLVDELRDSSGVIQEAVNDLEKEVGKVRTALENQTAKKLIAPRGIPEAIQGIRSPTAGDLSPPLNPIRDLEIAFVNGDSQLAYDAARKIINDSYGVRQEIMAVATAVITGAVDADDLIEVVWHKYKSDMPADQATLLVGSAVRYYDRRDREKDAETIVLEMVDYVDKHPDSTIEEKAFVWNQMANLTSDNEPQRAKEFEQKAIELDPSEPSYHYNLSLIYENLGQIDDALDSAEEALAMQGEEQDGDFYSQAIDVYFKKLEGLDSSDATSISETEERLRQLLRELRRIDQDLWRLQLLEPGLAPFAAE